jgi:hypothetical protein
VEVLVPSKTKKQAKFMAAVANNPKFAKQAGVPQSVGREYVKADNGRNFVRGGNVMPMGKGTYGSKVGRPPTQKYRAGRKVRDERDEEARVISEQDDHIDELRRIKGDRGSNRVQQRERVKGALRDEEDEMHRLRDETVGMRKGGKVRGCGIARQGVRPAKMVKMS